MKIAYSVIIHKPAVEVFDFVATQYFANQPRWVPGEPRFERSTDGPMTTGTVGRSVIKDKQGRPIERSIEVTEYVPDELLSLRSRTAASERPREEVFRHGAS